MPVFKRCLEKARLWAETNRSLPYFAETQYRLAKQRQAQDIVKYHTLARSNAKQGDVDAEIAAYQQAIASAEQIPYWIYQNLAEAFFNRNQLPEAIAYYRKVVETAPDYILAYVKLGDYFTDSGEHKKDPYFIRGYQLLVNQLLRLQRFSEASAVCNKALELMPENQLINALCREAGVQRENIKC